MKPVLFCRGTQLATEFNFTAGAIDFHLIHVVYSAVFRHEHQFRTETFSIDPFQIWRPESKGHQRYLCRMESQSQPPTRYDAQNSSRSRYSAEQGSETAR